VINHLYFNVFELFFEDLLMLSDFWYNSRDYRGNAEASDSNHVGKLSFWIMRRSNNRQNESPRP
jgi:hypothetical protein